MSRTQPLASTLLATRRSHATATPGAALLAALAMTASIAAPAVARSTSCAFQGASYTFEASPGATVAILSGVRDATPGHVERQAYTADQIRGLLAVLEIGTQTRGAGFENTAANQPECLKQQARAALATLVNGRNPLAR